MDFEFDRNTLLDLEIFESNTGRSMFSILDTTRTGGGKLLLATVMKQPTTCIKDLRVRKSIINFILTCDLKIDVDYHQLEAIEYYLSFNKQCLKNAILDALLDHWKYRLNPGPDYYRIQTGIKELIRLSTFASNLSGLINSSHTPDFFTQRLATLQKLLRDKVLVRNMNTTQEISCFDLNYLDNLFRKKEYHTVKELISFAYELDMFRSLADIVTVKGWCLPEYRDDNMAPVIFEGLLHPNIEKGVANDYSIDRQTNVVFLTGPNMAGKSAFLKAIGTSVYLSHLGFPVPAKRMTTPIFNGVITTINLPDNLTEGLSHFYSEVKRVKETALKLVEKGNMFVICDELFRGTNQEDALEATTLLISCFAKIKHSKFLVSSHLTGAVEELKQLEGIQFSCFDCTFIDGKPEFAYKIKEGTSHTRLGLYILKSEHVFNILNCSMKNTAN